MIPATVPAPGSLPYGDSVGSCRSSGVSIQPAVICPCRYAPDGSSHTPDGDPNMTTACCPSTIAIHRPGQSNDAGSAIGTSPRLRSASHCR